MEMKDIIFRIGYFRNKANLSARALSLEIDKNPAYITKLEAGEYEPSMQVVLDIIKACKITPEEFFYINPSNYAIDKKSLKLIDKLSERKKQALNILLNDIHE